MKVLLTHSYFPPDFAGGGEYYVLRTAEALSKRGVDIRVLVTGEPRGDDSFPFEVIRWPVHRYRLYLADRKIADCARDVDLIQTFNYHACLPSVRVARTRKIPVVCLALGIFGSAWLAMKGPILGRAAMAWEKYLFTRPYDRVVYLSDYSRDLGESLGIPPARGVVHTPGIDHHLFSAEPVKEHVVLFAAKLEPRKGVHEVLSIARDLPDVRFRVAGWGPLERDVRQANLPNLEFVGFLKGEELRRAYESASIFLLPSRAEGLPVALLEAMAAGCAVICSLPFDFDGIRLGDASAPELRRAVRELWDDPERTKELGRSNRARAQEYDWDQFGEELVDTYREVLSQSDRYARQPGANS